MEKFNKICPENSDYGTLDKFIELYSIRIKPEYRIQFIIEKIWNEQKLKKTDNKIDFNDFCFMYLLLKYESYSI